MFVDRDLSAIKFNERILIEAGSDRNPLIERLNFISIFESNLEEFFRVRVGSRIDSGKSKKALNEIYASISHLLPTLDDTFDNILKDGKRYFIYANREMLTSAERAYLKQLFLKKIAPIISPFIIDKSIPFPFFDNGQSVIGLTLETKNGKTKFGLIPIPKDLPKAVILPSDTLRFIPIKDVICEFCEKLFHKYTIKEQIVFSIIRNADIDEYEDLYNFGSDLRETMSKLIELRSKTAPISLRYNGEKCEKILRHLKKALCLSKKQMFYQKTPLKIDFLDILDKRLNTHPELYFKPIKSVYPTYAKATSVIDALRERDRLLMYPFEDIQFLLDLLSQASSDVRVRKIMITLYRVAENSKVVATLIDAVKRGISVTCVVELRARFDEKNNIDFSKQLQDAGCEVIYGLEDFKVHCKVLLIEFADGGVISQIGTGNFNEKTAKIYTDLSLFTADFSIADDLKRVFLAIKNNEFVSDSNRLLVAPLHFKEQILNLIDGEIEKCKNGEPCGITLKMNSLTDKDIMHRLERASEAGVKIQMIVRGVCCLIPGVSGVSDNITIKSIVGQLLEHSRIYAFGAGDDCKYFISSADFMTRNTDERVEIAVPVTDSVCKNKLRTILNLALSDTAGSYELHSDGQYRRVDESSEINMQQRLFEIAESGILNSQME